MDTLTSKDLINLIRSAFPPLPDDRNLGILVDLPHSEENDNRDWKERRHLAEEWFHHLQGCPEQLKLEGIQLIAYPDVGSNNADLPSSAVSIEKTLPSSWQKLEDQGSSIQFNTIFEKTQIFLALTEYSTTAPLKNAAVHYGFRAATMPGFSKKMIPALKIDYTLVSQRVNAIKEKLDLASGCDVCFIVKDQKEYKIHFDIRHRKAHASSGRFPEKGTAGNLPSGEAYIVPYEGEKDEQSRTEGILPVQDKDDLILFTIQENRAVRVEGEGTSVELENDRLDREPAYGNMAELGFGVLEEFGVDPIGEILLDEKLGFHVAFGRSDHFGGTVGPDDFSSPKEVIHLDQIYIPATQPDVTVKSLALIYGEGQSETIMKNGKYTIF